MSPSVRDRRDANRYAARLLRDADALWDSVRRDATTGTIYQKDEIVSIAELRAHAKRVKALLERPTAAYR